MLPSTALIKAIHIMANNGNMNPGAFQFIPGQGFVPSTPAQPQGAPGQQGAPGYNPYAQQQGGYAGGYGGYQGQQQYGQQGGYGGYQGQGYPQGGYQGGYQQGYQHGGYQQGGYQGRSSGYDGQQTFQPQGQQPFQPRQAQQSSGPSVSEQKPTGPAKTVSLSIGGGGSAPVPKSNEPRKVISLGAKKPAETTSASKTPAPAKSMSISIGGKKVATDAATSSTPSTRTSTPAPAVKKEEAKKEETKKEEKTEAAADWEEAEPAAPVALAAEVEKPAPAENKVKVSTGTTNFSRASAKTDTDAIAKEAATAADEETLKELYGGDTVDPNGTSYYLLVYCNILIPVLCVFSQAAS